MKTCVAIHGCHVEAKNWEQIVWGDPKNGVYGRAAAGIKLALDYGADMVSFSTGASERDGKKEAKLIFELARDRMADVIPNDGSVALFQKWLNDRAVIDAESQNTADEMSHLSENCEDRKIKKLYLVSSPWHLPRCLASALAFKAAGGFEGVSIFAHASDPDIYGADDIVIFEPPHRGDDPMLDAQHSQLPHKVLPLLFSGKLSADNRKDLMHHLHLRIRGMIGGKNASHL